LESLAKVYDPCKRDELREQLFELLHQFTHAVPIEQPPATLPKADLPAGNGSVAVTLKPVILVADDDPTLRALVKLSLECVGFACRLADNGALACTLARNDPPDAIVLDLDMPRMNGFEVLYALRNQWCTRKIPVILLTARREEADIANAAQLGALDYMTKPFEINDLIARLHAMVAPKHPKLALRSEA
jgi:CheY-like chemotaxis protein